MTEEKDNGIPNSEEEHSVEERVQENGTAESPSNENKESQAEKQEFVPFESGARTTGGITPSEYTFESKVEVQDDGDQSDDFVVDSEVVSDFLNETEQDKTEFEGSPKVKRTFDSSGSDYGSAIKGLISFFTIKRQDIGQQDVDAMERNFYLAPVIGGIFATILALEILGIYLLNYYFGLPLGLIAVVTVATVLIGSKFLHFDGLVDFGDGIVASGDKEKHIAAMKDSKIGAGGFGLALVIILSTVAIYFSVDWMFFPLFFIIPVTEVLIKNAMVSAAVNGTPGDGMAASQVENADGGTLIRSIMVSSALSFVGLAMMVVASWVMNKIYLHYYPGPWTTPLFSDPGLFIVAMAVALIAGIVASVYVGKYMSKVADKTFGSTSGDVLGATNEIARPVVSFVLLLTFLIIYRILTSI